MNGLLERVFMLVRWRGRAHARTVVDVLEGVREVLVTFVTRSKPADLPYP